MLIIAGQKLCGRVDNVPGKCYVKTRFLHLYYFPLIPLSSWVIEHGTERCAKFNGQRIPMSWKSVLFAWLQAGLFVFGLSNTLIGATVILAIHPGPNHVTPEALGLFVGIFCLIAWGWFTCWPYRADHDRARVLAGKLGLPYELNEDSFYSDQMPD